MKKLLLTLVLLCTSQLFVWASQSINWNFSMGSWPSYQKILAPTTVDGLTVLGAMDYGIYVVGEDYQTSMNGNYKNSLRIGGSPTQWDWTDTVPTNYAISFDVAGPCGIKIAALSQYQDQSTLAIKGPYSYQEIRVPQTFSMPAFPGITVPFFNLNYNGGPGKVYIYPSVGSLKLYEVIVDSVVVPVDTAEVFTFNAVVPKGTHQCWVVGTFSDWNNTIGQMHMVDSTHFTVSFPLGQEDIMNLEYKYLSGPGNWLFVEKGPNGEEINNRTWTPSDTVRSWANLYVPDSDPIAKDVTIEVFVPKEVNSMYVTGSFTDWIFGDNTKMTLVEENEYWKKFNLLIHTNDARYLSYKFSTGPSWNFSQTEDMEFHYPNVTRDTATHYMFGFWQFEGRDKWVKDWYMDNMWDATFTNEANFDGLDIYGAEGHPVTIMPDNKKYEQFTIFKKLVLPVAKLTNPEDHSSAEGGGIGISVGDTCQIAMICYSNDSVNMGEVYIHNGTNIIGVFNAPLLSDGELKYQVFNYTGGAGKIYFYSLAAAGVNVLYLGTTHFQGQIQENYVNFNVEVPAGTMQVYMAGQFNNWEPTHWMDRVDSTHFSTSIWGYDKTMPYKFCAGPSWDFREVNLDGSETENRLWKEMDKVERWANVFVPQYTRIYTEPIHTAYQSNFTVGVKSESTEPRQVISYQFTYSYSNWMMEYLGYETAGTVSEGGQIVVNAQQDYGVIYVSFMTTQPMNINGELIRFNFKAKSWGETWPNISEFYYNSDYIWDVYNNGSVFMEYYQEGDVDGNFMIQAYDAALTLQYSVGMDPLPTFDPLPWDAWRINAADVDHVEGVTANDASKILQHSAHLIYSFDDIDSTLWKAPYFNDADVLVKKEGNNLVFRSMGNLVGFNLFVNEHSDVLGTPVISNQVTMSAVNTENNNYAVGIANLKALPDSTIILTVPIVGNNVEMISLNMIVNAMGKDLKEAILTQNENTQESTIAVYPNPVTDHLIISNLNDNSIITIYDITGKRMYQETGQGDSHRIAVDAWNPGVYTVKVLSNEKSFTTKFIRK